MQPNNKKKRGSQIQGVVDFLKDNNIEDIKYEASTEKSTKHPSEPLDESINVDINKQTKIPSEAPVEAQKQSELNTEKEQPIEDVVIRRSYTLKGSTITKLEEMKVFMYKPGSNTLNEIVDEAICKLYDEKKKVLPNVTK